MSDAVGRWPFQIPRGERPRRWRRAAIRQRDLSLRLGRPVAGVLGAARGAHAEPVAFNESMSGNALGRGRRWEPATAAQSLFCLRCAKHCPLWNACQIANTNDMSGMPRKRRSAVARHRAALGQKSDLSKRSNPQDESGAQFAAWRARRPLRKGPSFGVGLFGMLVDHRQHGLAQRLGVREFRIGGKRSESAGHQRHGAIGIHFPVRDDRRTGACIEESARQARKGVRARLFRRSRISS